MNYLVVLNWTDCNLESSDKDSGAKLSLKGIVALVTPNFTQFIIQYGGASGNITLLRTWTSSKLLNCENLLPWENIVVRVPSIWLRTASESAVRAVNVGGFLVCIFRLLATPTRKSAIVSRFLVWEIVVRVGVKGEECNKGGSFWMHTSRESLITKITADSSSLFHYHLISCKYQCRHKPWSLFCHSSLFT